MSLGLGYQPRHPRRCPPWSYWSDGAYFVTIVTRKRRRILSTIVRGRVRVTPAGGAALACVLQVPAHHRGVRLGEFVLMPDHVHLLLHLEHADASLSRVVNLFKGAATRAIRRLPDPPTGILWQASFHDSIIRDGHHLEAVERYIRDNPRKWRG